MKSLHLQSIAKKKKSRTKNTIYNLITSFGSQLFHIILQFAVRTVFIHTLGKAYLGIGGLFSNILTMLSLAELGVGSAIIFKLYKPIANNDNNRISALMKFYKQIYRVIGLVVALIGLCLIPFLPWLIKDYDKLATLNINAVFIFCLYLFKSVSSYLFFAYRSAIIKANQKEYLINIIDFIFRVAFSILQIILLLVYPNFVAYLALSIFEVILKNIVVAIISSKLFPYINEQSSERLSRSEIKEVFKDCGALMLYKLNGVVLKATDNIVISSFLGLEYVGLYANYYMLYTFLHSVFTKLFGAVAHSLGNLHATTSGSHEYEIFRKVHLIAAIIGGTASVGIAVCSDELVQNWIGHDWIIAQPFSFLLGLEVITLSFRHFLSRYRTTMGLFQQAKYRPVLGAVINIIVSVVLVRFWGINGVLVGTILADWLTLMWYDPIIIHKYGFKAPEKIKGYFLRTAKYILVIALTGVLDYYLCKRCFVGRGWLSLIIHGILCGITVPVVLVTISSKSSEGKFLLHFVFRIFRKIIPSK